MSQAKPAYIHQIALSIRTIRQGLPVGLGGQKGRQLRDREDEDEVEEEDSIDRAAKLFLPMRRGCLHS